MSDQDLPFVSAAFPSSLQLPQPSFCPLENVRQAIRLEYNDSVTWKHLRCRNVRVASESEAGVICELQTGHAMDFDWTWEGSTAFSPSDLQAFQTQPSKYANTPETESDDLLWIGEVLEVDEAGGKIFIRVEGSDRLPRTGSFFVRPFEFLAVLNDIYNNPRFASVQPRLPARLEATKGSVHPPIKDHQELTGAALPQLQDWWKHSWSILWGPPGTGKTYTTGQQVAATLDNSDERILVISTTNDATDSSAVAIGNAARQSAAELLHKGHLLRVGKGASLRRFRKHGLQPMLRGTQTEYLRLVESLQEKLRRADTSDLRAELQARLKDVRSSMRHADVRNFQDPAVRVVVSTAFRAMTMLSAPEILDALTKDTPPFTTIFIDEAGLISRAAVAALSLLASRRIVLVGDARQLAPISRICRLLPPGQMTWLSSSGLSHLSSLNQTEPGIHVLREQRRMHPDVCRVVSEFQYDGGLTTAPERIAESPTRPQVLQQAPRCIWYVLDQDAIEHKAIRSERGRGNSSWTRAATGPVLQKLFQDTSLRKANGLFITPFKAQANEVAAQLLELGCLNWSASTVHSRQGAEADIVIFDSVNAGSHCWPAAEWKRLVNVAISRARETILVLASKAEMQSLWLQPLRNLLQPCFLKSTGGKTDWQQVSVAATTDIPHAPQFSDPNCIGAQLWHRQQMRPVMSQEQQRLCGLRIDGKPRLVRGVAGSGKTLVLAHWLLQSIRKHWERPDFLIWVVYANRSLEDLIRYSIQSTWDREYAGRQFPWERVQLLHIKELLRFQFADYNIDGQSSFDYDDDAARLLHITGNDHLKTGCDAMFIDEAQDMGPNTIQLLHQLVRPADSGPNSGRPIHIFYDNAQNLYGRGTPRWSELGMQMRGRSTVMKESFRSTRPISEFALNVLYQLEPPDQDEEHQELLKLGLLESSQRLKKTWWDVCFNQIDGPLPELRESNSVATEYAAILDYLHHLLVEQQVRPQDICILYMGQRIRNRIEKRLTEPLLDMGATLCVRTNREFMNSTDKLFATTPHSFKGFDAEVVIIPDADCFFSQQAGILSHALYVAMTRARSILTLFAGPAKNESQSRICSVLQFCLAQLQAGPQSMWSQFRHSDMEPILKHIGQQHRGWLQKLSNQQQLIQEPLLTIDGKLLLEPLFWYESHGRRVACFGNKAIRPSELRRLQQDNVYLLNPGATAPGPPATT